MLALTSRLSSSVLGGRVITSASCWLGQGGRHQKLPFVDDGQKSRLAGSQAVSGFPEDAKAAFVFDIDGVLLRGATVLQEARRALARLYSPCCSRPLAPVAFLTNGGGMLEGDRADALTRMLGVKVTADQVVMAHTPMRALAAAPNHPHEALADRPVLLCGKGALLEVAASYGFQRAITTEQLAAAYPASVPLSTASSSSSGASSLQQVLKGGIGTEAAPIEAVLVMTDPTDWGRDIQLIVDTVSSGGVPVASPSPSPGSPSRQRDPPPVFVGHADLLWASDWPRPRFGLGAFAIALEALYKEATGEPCPTRYYGKPQPGPFRMVEELLERQAKEMGWERAEGSNTALDAIFMVGDNPRVDVRGANAAREDSGLPWKSVLVRTGVFQVLPPYGPDAPLSPIIIKVSVDGGSCFAYAGASALPAAPMNVNMIRDSIR